MIFTMRKTAHPDRQTAFEKTAARLGMICGHSKPGCPWQNGYIERSNRTDNEACFKALRFVDAEDRRYQLRLWEMHYNHCRPHQGIGRETPENVYRQQFPLLASGCMRI